jgi:hypothetical protein
MPTVNGTFTAAGDVSAGLVFAGLSYFEIRAGSNFDGRVVLQSRQNSSAAWSDVRESQGLQLFQRNGQGCYTLPNPEGNRTRAMPEQWECRLRCSSLPSGSINYTLVTNAGLP